MTGRAGLEEAQLSRALVGVARGVHLTQALHTVIVLRSLGFVVDLVGEKGRISPGKQVLKCAKGPHVASGGVNFTGMLTFQKA